ITLADVNKLASNWITDNNRVIIAQSPQKDSVKVPTRAELLAVFERAAKTPVTAYTENLSSGALLSTEPKAGSITAMRTIPEIGVTEWMLSNGARVLVKPTDFKADEVLFGGYKEGGLSLVPNSEFMSARLASQIASLSGIGQFNAVDLRKK